MFVTNETLAAGHLGKKMCRRGAKRKRRSLSVNADQLVAGMDFCYHDQIQKKVNKSKYLDRMLYFDESKCNVVVRNFMRARWKGVSFYHLLGRKEDYTRTSGRF